MSNENILNSMLGNEQILIIEDKLSNSLRLGNSKFGGGRTTTISETNYLSAVGRLRNDLTLDIFHNPYASCPLNRHHAKLFANHQFFIQKPINSFYSMWHVWEPTDTL